MVATAAAAAAAAADVCVAGCGGKPALRCVIHVCCVPSHAHRSVVVPPVKGDTTPQRDVPATGQVARHPWTHLSCGCVPPPPPPTHPPTPTSCCCCRTRAGSRASL
jgi:hypothetical protein